MQTTLIALSLLFPQLEVVSIKPIQKETNWSIVYEMKSNNHSILLTKSINSKVDGRLWNTVSHKDGFKLKNFYLILKDPLGNYAVDQCGFGSYKTFRTQIRNEQGKELDHLILRPNQRFKIYLDITHTHPPESTYDLLCGYLDIRLMILHNKIDYHAILAEQYKLKPPLITLSEPTEHYLTTDFFKTPPNSIILSTLLDDTQAIYLTSFFKVLPKSKITVEFYYYVPANLPTELDFYTKFYTLNHIVEEKKEATLIRKFGGWHQYRKTFVVPQNSYEMALRFESESGIVFIDDIKVTPEGLNP